MAGVRTLKKHANRRFYDTKLKKYVSTAEIHDLILAGTDVQILDSGSGDDITRSVLLQIMADCEQSERPMLSPALLMTLIRQYGHPMQDFVGPYLENSLVFYMRQEARLRKQMSGLFESRQSKKGKSGKFSKEVFAAMRENLLKVLASGQQDPDP